MGIYWLLLKRSAVQDVTWRGLRALANTSRWEEAHQNPAAFPLFDFSTLRGIAISSFISFSRFLTLALGALSLAASPALAWRVLDITPVTSSVLMLHLVDGTARHETLGNGFDGPVKLEPLDTAKAADVASYRLSSPDDAAFGMEQHPQSTGRKSKGREVVKNGGKFEWVPGHWIFLRLAQPMKNGKSYSLGLANSLVTEPQPLKWRFDERSSRSEAVHVNQIGFRCNTRKSKFW